VNIRVLFIQIMFCFRHLLTVKVKIFYRIKMQCVLVSCLWWI